MVVEVCVRVHVCVCLLLHVKAENHRSEIENLLLW